MTTHRRRAGMTLLEVAIVTVIIGTVLAIASTGMRSWQEAERTSSVVRRIADLYRLASIEAIRTGRVQIVFASIGGAGDTAGNPLEDSSGDWVPALLLDDGAPGTANQDCEIDAGEARQLVLPAQGMRWGVTFAGAVKAPGDDTAIAISSGSTFSTPAGAASTWVAFMPDGRPLGFDNACSMGQLGSGNGALYVTNGSRDYAVVLNALGGVRIHVWDRQAGRWQG